MCLLAYCPAGKTPDIKHLEYSCTSNPHGFGYAIINNNDIIVGKSLDATKLIKEFMAIRKRYPNSPAIFHSRYATSGEQSTKNCHPFIVGKDKKTIIAHNGMLPIITPLSDDRSDTAIFAEDILPLYLKKHKGGLDNKMLMTAIADWAYGSKLVILTTNPQYKNNVYIVNEKAGHYDARGIWYSNYSYLPPAPKAQKMTAPIQDDYYACYTCETPNEFNADICVTCEYCLYCDEYYLECICKHSKYYKSKDNQLDLEWGF